VDLSAIIAALAAVEVAESSEATGRTAFCANPTNFAGLAGAGRERLTEQEQMLTAAQARVAALEAEVAGLRARLGQIMALAQGVPDGAAQPGPRPRANQRNREAVCAGHAISLEQSATLPQPPRATSATPAATAANRSGFGDAPRFHESAMSDKPAASGTKPSPTRAADHGATLHPAARKLLAALAQHAPARFTWGQAATLAGLKAAGGHYNAGRKQLRDLDLVEEAGNLVAASPAGLDAAGEVPSAPSTPGERLALWCERLPSPAPEMLRSLASHGGRYTEVIELAAALGKKPTGGHWNSGLALLRNNGLVEVSGKRLRVSELFR